MYSVLQVENESPAAKLPSKQGATPEQTSVLEESIVKISRDLSTISRNQKYFRTRENRNFSTVKSTESRIFNFSIVESAMIVAMAGLQVFIVRFFFQGARKGIILHSSIMDHSVIGTCTDILLQVMCKLVAYNGACRYILFSLFHFGLSPSIACDFDGRISRPCLT